MEWKDRIVENPRKRKIETNSDGTVDISKVEGQVYQEGTPKNAENFNLMQDRIDTAWGTNSAIDNRVEWIDHKVQYPNRYKIINNPDGTVDIIPAKGSVLQQGTPVNAVNLNKMEDRIDNMINIPSDATAKAEHIAGGKTAYVGQMEKIVGTMPNRGSFNATLTFDYESVKIPKGYHDGTGTIKANITNLTSGNIRNGVEVGGVRGSFVGNRLMFIRYYDDSTQASTLPSEICMNRTLALPKDEVKRDWVSLGWQPDGLIFSWRDSNYSYYTDISKPSLYVTSKWTGNLKIGDAVNDNHVYLLEVETVGTGFVLTFKGNPYKNSEKYPDMTVFAYQLRS